MKVREYLALFSLATVFGIGGCLATGEVGELLGTRPTQAPVEGGNELTKAGEAAKNIGEVTPPPAGGWVEWGGAVLLGLGTLLQEKRVRKRNKDIKARDEVIANVKALQNANGGNADFKTNKAALKANTSPEAQAVIDAIKANETLFKLVKSTQG